MIHHFVAVEVVPHGERGSAFRIVAEDNHARQWFVDMPIFTTDGRPLQLGPQHLENALTLLSVICDDPQRAEDNGILSAGTVDAESALRYSRRIM